MKEKLSRSFAKNIEQKTFDVSSRKEGADANWIINHSQLHCLKLDIDVPYKQIEEEINSIPSELFVGHRDEEHEDNRGWKSFVLHGKSYDATREDEYYNDTREMTWTSEAIQYCPQTINYFKNTWPCNEFYRIRIMLLEPQGIINLHQDAVPNGILSAVNIAITQPNNCKFYLDNYGVIPFESGTAFLIDISNLHAVINDSNERRYHIIVHHKKLTKKFDFLIEKSYNKHICKPNY
jgi:hypothetical protein